MRRTTHLILPLIILMAVVTPAQYLSAVSSGFTNAAGLTVNPATGDIFVADTGDGTPGTGGIHRLPAASPAAPVSFVSGLASELVSSVPVGVHGVSFRANGNLLVAIGGSAIAGQSGHVLEFDATGAQVAAHDVGTFALTQFASTNIFSAAEGPNGDLFVTDSANDSVIQIDNATGSMSVFATLAGVANNTGVGNNPAQAVPTKIIFDGTNFYVACFGGFPHLSGWSQVYQIDAAGASTLWVYGMTCLNDIAIDPTDGELTMLSFGTYSQPNGFATNTGSISKVVGATIKTLSRGLYYPAGMAFDAAGNLNISFPLAGTVSSLYSTELLPGSGEDFAISGWVFPQLPVDTPQPVTAGSYVYVSSYSPNCGMCGAESLLIAEVFSTGTPPFTVSTFPSLQFSTGGAMVIPVGLGGPLGAPLVSEFGTTLSFVVPAGLSGNSVRFQALAITNTAANGFFATTDATQFDVY